MVRQAIAIGCLKLQTTQMRNPMNQATPQDTIKDTPLTKRQQIAMIDHAWAFLQSELENISMTRYGKQYLALNMQEERDHRGGSRNHGLTAPQAARLFAVKQLAECVNGRKKPSLRDYMFSRTSPFMAHSLWLNHPTEIVRAFHDAGIDPKFVAKFDYVKLNEA